VGGVALGDYGVQLSGSCGPPASGDLILVHRQRPRTSLASTKGPLLVPALESGRARSEGGWGSGARRGVSLLTGNGSVRHIEARGGGDACTAGLVAARGVRGGDVAGQGFFRLLEDEATESGVLLALSAKTEAGLVSAGGAALAGHAHHRGLLDGVYARLRVCDDEDGALGRGGEGALGLGAPGGDGSLGLGVLAEDEAQEHVEAANGEQEESGN